MNRARTSTALIVFTALLAMRGCSCGEKTDEERLRQMVDTLKVHVYVGAKVALVSSEDDPEIAEAREAIQRAMASLERSQGSVESLRGSDVAAVATALFRLRGLGRDEVDLGHASTLPPLIPALGRLGTDDSAPPGDGLNRDTDHALILLALTAMKFHPRSPVPIPAEILLYESWMTRSEEIQLEGIVPWVRSVKAYHYATSELCDLAKQETDALESTPSNPEQAAALVQGLGRLIAHAPQAGAIIAVIAVLPTVARLLAHGSTAMCMLDRGQDEAAAEEIQRVVDVAEANGVPPEDTALLRAFVAFKHGDLPATREYLVQAKQSDLITDQGRAEIDEVIAYLDGGERGPLSDYFDKAFITAFAAKLAFAQLASIETESDEDSRLFQELHRFASALTQGIASANETVSGWGNESSESWTERISSGCQVR